MMKNTIDFNEHYNALLQFIEINKRGPKDKETFEGYNIGTWYQAQIFRLKNNMTNKVEEKEKIESIVKLISDEGSKDFSITEDKNLESVSDLKIEDQSVNEIMDLKGITTKGIKINKPEVVKEDKSDKEKNQEVIRPVNSKSLFLSFLKLSKEEIKQTLDEIIYEDDKKYNTDVLGILDTLGKITADLESNLDNLKSTLTNNLKDYHIDGYNQINLNLNESNLTKRDEIMDRLSQILIGINGHKNNLSEKLDNEQAESTVLDSGLESDYNKEEDSEIVLGFSNATLEDQGVVDNEESDFSNEKDSNNTETHTSELNITNVFSEEVNHDEKNENEEINNEKEVELEEEIKFKF